MSMAEFSAIFAVTAQPLSADFARAHFIQLHLYAHRVDGLQPGVYRCWPELAELEQVKSGDQRVASAGSEPRATVWRAERMRVGSMIKRLGHGQITHTRSV